jgi:hypothetical protein
MVEDTKELIAALIKARQAIPPLVDSKKVDFTANGRRIKYSYIELPSLLEAIQPHLLANDLFLSQAIETKEGHLRLVTAITHASGSSIESTLALYGDDCTIASIDTKQLYSGITTHKRQAIMALLGLAASDEDDDGQIANDTPAARSKPQPKPTTKSDEERAKLMQEIKNAREKKGMSKESLLKRYPNIREMDIFRLKEVLNRLDDENPLYEPENEESQDLEEEVS